MPVTLEQHPQYSLYSRTHTSIRGTRPGGGSIGWCQSYKIPSCPISIGLARLGDNVIYTEEEIKTAFSNLPIVITSDDRIPTVDDKMELQYVPGLYVICNISSDVLLTEMDSSMTVAGTVYERTERGGLVFVKTQG